MPDEPNEIPGPSGPAERGGTGPSGPTERGDTGPSGPTERGGTGPTALPAAGARAIAFIAILVAGGCGLLIGRALVLLQCKDCADEAGVGGLVGAVVAAAGVAVIAVLVLRAMGEWQAGPDQRRS